MYESPRNKNYTWFGEEHDMLRKTVRDWCLKELYPYRDEWEEQRLFPREVFNRAGAGFVGNSGSRGIRGIGS